MKCRSGPNQTLPTRYTYTGQYSYINDEATDLGSADFGLMFYNARWYDPYLNHFTQPDTIVPDPYNPLDYDRYSYARNSPILYVDPSGHTPCDADGYCGYGPTFESVAALFGVRFENGSKTWTNTNKANGLRAIVDEAINLSYKTGKIAVNAFRNHFNTSSVPIVLLMGNNGSQFANDGSGYYDHDNNPKTPDKPKYCEITSGGCTVGITRYKETGQPVNLIKFETLSSNSFRARNNIVHELGHVLYNIYTPTMGGSFSRDALIPNPRYADGEILEWQQHPGADGSELFADTFIAWTYNAWSTDPLNVNAVSDARNAMDGLVR